MSYDVAKVPRRKKDPTALLCYVLNMEDKLIVVSEDARALRMFMDVEKAREYAIAEFGPCYIIDLVHNGLHYYIPSKENPIFDVPKIEMVYAVLGSDFEGSKSDDQVVE